MIFEVEEKIDFIGNGFQKKIKNKFNLDISVFEKKSEYRIYIIKKEKTDTIAKEDNIFLCILSSLEEQNYPIKIKTDTHGNFLEIYDFENWLNEFKEKTDSIISNYEDSENAKDIRNKYYDLIKNKDVFTKNKFKEAFWNVFFFNPTIDDKNKPNNETALEWNIKSIGSMQCLGKTKLVNPASKEITIHFESIQDISEDFLEKIKDKTKDKELKLEEVKVKVITESYFDTIQKKIKNKKGLFKCSIKDAIFYEEEITITLKK